MSSDDRFLENDYYDMPDEDTSIVCITCLSDTYLIDNLRDRFYYDQCSFCGENTNVVNTEDLFEEILDAILSDGWVKAIDQGSYCSAEGGYQHETEEIKELTLTYCGDSGISNESLINCVYDCFSEELMIDKPYGEDYYDEHYIHDWEDFKRNVKYFQRYTSFLNVGISCIVGFKNLMQFIGEKHVVSLNRSSSIFRGRTFNSVTPDINASSYGPPGIEYTKNSRMSPKGIACLYCSSNIHTVISEIKTTEAVSIGIIKIKPQKDLRLIDLINISLPSAFDKNNRHYRRSLEFLEAFIEDISKPINIDDQEHLEFMPTQVIFEYIRYVFESKGVAGIQYRSSKHKEGINYAFFCNEQNFNQMFELVSKKVKIISLLEK